MRIVGKLNDWKAFLKLVYYVQLWLKRPPQITLSYFKKVKGKSTILCVFIVYSIAKKNSKVKKKCTIR